MSSLAIRRWYLVHKWTSLVCTAFLLTICVTGLPLVFRGEIYEAVQTSREPEPRVPGDTRAVGIDRLITSARERFPGQMITTISLDDDDPVVFIGMVPSFAAVKADSHLYHWLKFDTRTGEIINTSEQFQQDSASAVTALVSGLMAVMLRLHTDLYGSLPGALFMGFMGLLFVAAIVSGGVLYGPFMKKIPFGTVRMGRAVRLKWLDLHNLLGIVALAWSSVVGLTGAINEISGPLFGHWMQTDVREAWAPYRGNRPPAQGDMASAQGALDIARRALPGMTINSMLFPQPDFGSVYHYWFWASGNTPLTGRLSTAVLVDARTGALTKVLEMPWYLRILELSRPLHFGDYGGLPLKIIWAMLDLITIVVLGSGLYLWIARRKQNQDRLAKLIEARASLSRPSLVSEVKP